VPPINLRRINSEAFEPIIINNEYQLAIISAQIGSLNYSSTNVFVFDINKKISISVSPAEILQSGFIISITDLVLNSSTKST